MKVRIIGGSDGVWWYNDKIGEIYEVEDFAESTYKVVGGDSCPERNIVRGIKKCHCEIVDYRRCYYYKNNYGIPVTEHFCNTINRCSWDCTKNAAECKDYVDKNIIKKSKNMRKIKKVVKKSPKNCVNLCDVDESKVYGFLYAGEIHIITRVACATYRIVNIEASGVWFEGREYCTWFEGREYCTLFEAVEDTIKKYDVYQADDIYSLIEGLKED